MYFRLASCERQGRSTRNFRGIDPLEMKRKLRFCRLGPFGLHYGQFPLLPFVLFLLLPVSSFPLISSSSFEGADESPARCIIHPPSPSPPLIRVLGDNGPSQSVTQSETVVGRQTFVPREGSRSLGGGCTGWGDLSCLVKAFGEEKGEGMEAKRKVKTRIRSMIGPKINLKGGKRFLNV